MKIPMQMGGVLEQADIIGNSKVTLGSRHEMYRYEKVGFISAVISITSNISQAETVVTLPYAPISNIYIPVRNDSTGAIIYLTVDGRNLKYEFGSLSAGSYRIGAAVLLK